MVWPLYVNRFVLFLENSHDPQVLALIVTAQHATVKDSVIGRYRLVILFEFPRKGRARVVLCDRCTGTAEAGRDQEAA